MVCKKPSLSLTVLDNTNDDATCTAAVLGVDISFLKGGGGRGFSFNIFNPRHESKSIERLTLVFACIIKGILYWLLNNQKCSRLVASCQFYRLLGTFQQVAKNLSISSSCNKSSYLFSFMETPRKFIIARLSIRKLGSSSVLIIIIIISTDEDPSLRNESFAIMNLRGVSTKLNKYIDFTMQTYKELTATSLQQAFATGFSSTSCRKPYERIL